MRSNKKSHPVKPSNKSKTSSHKSNNTFSIPEGELDLFHYMINHIGDEIVVINHQGNIVFVNKAAIRGLGYSKKNLLQRNIIDFFEQRMSVQQWKKTYFSKVIQKKKPISYVVNRIVKGGKVRTVDLTAVSLSYQSKDYVLSVGRDITEQLTFQDKFKESEDRYRLLSEQAADGILMLDPKGVTLYANNSAAKMFKASATKIVGSHFETHVKKSSLSQVGEYFRKVSGGTPIIHSELEIKDKKGNFIPIEFTASPIVRNNKVVQIHVIFRDISQKKKVESLVQESEKMEALQNFITGTTHEIQQPLKGLLDHSQNLIDRYKDRHFEYIGFKEFKDIMKTLQTMNDQVRYCFDTTDRLNSLNRRKAKLEGGHCNINHAIRDTMKMLKHSFEVSDIKLKLKLSSRLPRVAINRLDMGQALNNILTNALQSLPGSGGKIEVKTTYLKSKNAVRIDCQDDGVGIPNEVLSHVFDPFFTTKSRGLEKNSGLGLYVVYSIIKANQGEIFVKSSTCKGTFVTIILPVYKSGSEKVVKN